MKFLSKYLAIIYLIIVFIPTIFAWYVYFYACNKQSIFYLGWSCTDVFMVFLAASVVAFAGSIIVTLLNLITKKNSLLLFIGGLIPLFAILYLIIGYLAFKNANFIL